MIKPTHYWLMRHVYNPLRRRKINRLFCGFFTFFLSAVFHEYIISGALGKIHYAAFLAMMLNFPAAVFQEIIKKAYNMGQSTFNNVMFWISFCFLGQPLCIVLYLYSYYSDNPQFLDRPY